MKAKTWLLAICLTISVVFSARAENVSPSLQDFTQDRTVLIIKDCDNDSKDSWGSGVILQNDKVVTAEHVVDDMEGCTLEVSREGEKSYPALVLKTDPDVDLALLTVAHDYRLRTLTAESRLGEPIIVTGYPSQPLDPRNQYFSILFGNISTKDIVKWNGVRKDRISAEIYFGNSGGPVWNSAGQLVGIVTSGHIDIPGYRYTARGKDVQAFLEEA